MTRPALHPSYEYRHALVRDLTLGGALAAAEFEGERLVVAPILVDLGEEVGGFGERGGKSSEGFHFVADDVVAEGFAGAAVRDEVIEDACDGLGRETGGDGLNSQAEAHDAFVVITATEEHLVIGQLAAVDLA